MWQIAFSPDGQLLAVAVDPNGVEGFYVQQRQGEVQLWDVDSRQRVGRAMKPGGGSVLSLAFDPEGTLLATGSYGGRLDLWDVSTQGTYGEPMRVADDGFLGVAFDRSGRLVAGGGAIGPVRVFRVDDQQPAFPPLSGHTGPVTGVAFDPRARSSRLRARSAGRGSGTRPAVSPTATSWSEARGRSPGPSTFRSWGCGARSARTANAWPSRESTSAACCGTSIPGGLAQSAPARSTGRNLSREEWRASTCPVRDAVSRDVLGVAHELSRSFGGAARPCPTVRNFSPLRNPTSVRPRGIVAGARVKAPWLQ